MKFVSVLFFIFLGSTTFAQEELYTLEEVCSAFDFAAQEVCEGLPFCKAIVLEPSCELKKGELEVMRPLCMGQSTQQFCEINPLCFWSNESGSRCVATRSSL